MTERAHGPARRQLLSQLAAARGCGGAGAALFSAGPADALVPDPASCWRPPLLTLAHSMATLEKHFVAGSYQIAMFRDALAASR